MDLIFFRYSDIRPQDIKEFPLILLNKTTVLPI